MKHNIMYVIASLLLTSTYITAMKSPLSSSQDDKYLAELTASLKDDNNFKKSTEISDSPRQSISEILDEKHRDKNIIEAPNNTPTTTPETLRKKGETFSITGYYVDTSKGEFLPNNVPIYNAHSRKCLYPGSVDNYQLEHLTFKDKNGKERKIVAKIDDKYNGQSHVIIVDNSPNQDEPYIINLQQIQRDVIRYPHIRFHKKQPDLTQHKSFNVTSFEKNNNTYNIEYVDTNNNLQQISLSSARDYNNESFAIITIKKGEYIFLKLPEETAPTQPTQSSTDSSNLTGIFSNNPSSELTSYPYKRMESMGGNKYIITYMVNGSEKEIIVTATELYENQNHFIVAGNDEQDAFVIDLQYREIETNLEEKPVTLPTTATEIEIKKQEETTQQALDASKEILEEEREQKLQTSSSCDESQLKDVKDFIDGLDVFKEIMEEKIKQKLQTSSSSSESSQFRDIKDMLKEQEDLNKQQEEQQELEKIENTVTNLEEKPVTLQTTPTEIEVKEQEETAQQALNAFKEVLEEDRKLQTSSSSKEDLNKKQEKQQKLEKIENPEQKISSNPSPNSVEKTFKQLQNQLNAQSQKQKLQQQPLENSEKLEKKILDNRRKRNTYIAVAATLTALLGLILYLYKNNKLPDILSQLPDVVSNSFKKFMPTT